MTLRHIIWFQGESDVINNWNSAPPYSAANAIAPPALYACQQPALITAWRNVRGGTTLPLC